MRQFYLFIVDNEAKVFNVKGPMTDDTAWIEKVVATQEKGRSVNCISKPNDKPLEILKQDYAEATGYAYTETPII